MTDKQEQDTAGGTGELQQAVINLVIAAREFWDDNNDLSDTSKALDEALEPFSSMVRFVNEPDDGGYDASAHDAGKLRGWLDRHLEKTPMLPIRVDEMNEVEAAIFNVAAYHHGFLQFLQRHVTTS